MNRRFIQYKTHIAVIYWLILANLHGIINGYSVLADIQRRGLVFASWEPFVWEMSSQIAMLMLIPLLLYLDNKRPLSFNRIKSGMVYHLTISVFFSLLHVSLMVALRELSYCVNGRDYQFGDWSAELLYEYRKDVMTYSTIIITFYVFRFIVSRLSSEAMEITTGEDSLPPAYVERFIVKKLGKEFIVRSSDIEWIEAAGNYTNIHLGGRCYPLRSTMDALITRLDPKNFARIHRSSIVNLNVIVEILPLDSGDFEILLNNEKTLKLSRRYRDDIKKKLQG